MDPLNVNTWIVSKANTHFSGTRSWAPRSERRRSRLPSVPAALWRWRPVRASGAQEAGIKSKTFHNIFTWESENQQQTIFSLGGGCEPATLLITASSIHWVPLHPEALKLWNTGFAVKHYLAWSFKGGTINVPRCKVRQSQCFWGSAARHVSLPQTAPAPHICTDWCDSCVLSAAHGE